MVCVYLAFTFIFSSYVSLSYVQAIRHSGLFICEKSPFNKIATMRWQCEDVELPGIVFQQASPSSLLLYQYVKVGLADGWPFQYVRCCSVPAWSKEAWRLQHKPAKINWEFSAWILDIYWDLICLWHCLDFLCLQDGMLDSLIEIFWCLQDGVLDSWFPI